MGVKRHKFMMSSKLWMATLSSAVGVLSDIILIVLLRASGPFI